MNHLLFSSKLTLKKTVTLILFLESLECFLRYVGELADGLSICKELLQVVVVLKVVTRC